MKKQLIVAVLLTTNAYAWSMEQQKSAPAPQVQEQAEQPANSARAGLTIEQYGSMAVYRGGTPNAAALEVARELAIVQDAVFQAQRRAEQKMEETKEEEKDDRVWYGWYYAVLDHCSIQ